MDEGRIKICSFLRFGPPPKTQATLDLLLNDFETTIFVNLRNETGYKCKPSEKQRDQYDKYGLGPLPTLDSSKKYELLLLVQNKRKDVEIVYCPLEDGKSMEDEQVFQLAKKVYTLWKKDPTKSMYIHNRDGLGMEAIVAFTVYGLIKHNATFDPLKWLKENGHYEVCVERAQKEQLTRCWKKAMTLSRWKTFF